MRAIYRVGFVSRQARNRWRRIIRCRRSFRECGVRERCLRERCHEEGAHPSLHLGLHSIALKPVANSSAEPFMTDSHYALLRLMPIVIWKTAPLAAAPTCSGPPGCFRRPCSASLSLPRRCSRLLTPPPAGNSFEESEQSSIRLPAWRSLYAAIDFSRAFRVRCVAFCHIAGLGPAAASAQDPQKL